MNFFAISALDTDSIISLHQYLLCVSQTFKLRLCCIHIVRYVASAKSSYKLRFVNECITTFKNWNVWVSYTGLFATTKWEMPNAQVQLLSGLRC